MSIAIGSKPTLATVTTLLASAQLPTTDINEELLENFFFAGTSDQPIGIIGLELFPPHALLRSLVVDASVRASRVGSQLLEHAERHARVRGVHTVYLLTNTAETFFARRGYSRVSRAEAPPAISSSAEFASLCPASAAFMAKTL
jgi:amino-acid N-acetyltransferase